MPRGTTAFTGGGSLAADRGHKDSGFKPFFHFLSIFRSLEFKLDGDRHVSDSNEVVIPRLGSTVNKQMSEQGFFLEFHSGLKILFRSMPFLLVFGKISTSMEAAQSGARRGRTEVVVARGGDIEPDPRLHSAGSFNPRCDPITH